MGQHGARARTLACLLLLHVSWLAACAGPDRTSELAPTAVHGVHAIRDTVASCTACSIELTPLVSLGSSADSVLLTRTPVLVRDSRGRTIAAVPDHGFQPVIVYRPDGTVEQTLGRQGSGPGEHTRVEAIAVTEGDSIVLAHSYLRFSVFAPDGRFIRGGPLPTPPHAVMHLPNGGFIINGTLRSGPASTLPLHALAADGTLLRSFGTPNIFVGGTLERILAPCLVGADFWLSERGQYRLEHIDTTGRTTGVITVATPWWFVFSTPAEVKAYFDTVRPPDEMPRSADRRPPRLARRPPFGMVSVVPDSTGLLWVAQHTHVDAWDTLDAEYDRGTSEVRLADEMKGRMYRTVFDVIDPEQGMLFARRIIPGYGWVANDGAFIQMHYREDGIVAMNLFSMRLQGLP